MKIKRIIFLLSFSCFFSLAHAAKQQDVLAASQSWRDANSLTILNDFRDLLSLKNVATNFDDMTKNADWIESYLQRRNFQTQRLIEGGAPYIFAERKTPGAQKTVLIYAHYDGQPVKAENWQSSAWTPVLRDDLVESGGKDVAWPTTTTQINSDWRIFARSAGDDKAPVIGVMAAIDALDKAGITPSVNIKLLFDGEEEISSPSLKNVLDKHADLLATDLMLFCDGPMHQSRERQLVFGVRGVSGLNITTYGPARPLHSGHYGNWSQNAAENMVSLLASIHHSDGKVAIKGFYDSVPKMTETERAAIAAMPNIDSRLKHELALNQSRLKNTRIEEAIMQPGAIITGIQVGTTGRSARNVIVSEANASINFRLVPNQTPLQVKNQTEAYFKSLGYKITYQEPTDELLRNNEKLI
ncbi:M20/M25/M40 family metallo-hydrolase [Aliikangiella marina]|uniref:M20/M25/M40 family metallo-hydrolase n=1 Tax=Aliikangiella marina TaxID=1712262 RepID=A0A545TE55_9GAMM|nr:M20/M25/M40 family metallo-hydrolase [Aliikangiella marina]TQV75471.1 M20/M25/M40 family metallo-hydrolase [Aliikangiella marina]